MTLNQLTTEIAGRFGKELDMQYKQWLVPQVNQWRSRLIRNSLEKNPQDKSQFIQNIHIPLTYGNYTSPCSGLSCMGSYSEEIPKLFRIGSTPFEYIGPSDGSSPYRNDDIGTAHYIAQGMTSHLYNDYELWDNRVIIKNKRIASIMGAGIFDEPEKVMAWQCKNSNQGCDWWNEEYPCTNDVTNMIVTSMWQTLGEPKAVLPEKQDQDE